MSMRPLPSASPRMKTPPAPASGAAEAETAAASERSTAKVRQAEGEILSILIGHPAVQSEPEVLHPGKAPFYPLGPLTSGRTPESREESRASSAWPTARGDGPVPSYWVY